MEYKQTHRENNFVLIITYAAHLLMWWWHFCSICIKYSLTFLCPFFYGKWILWFQKWILSIIIIKKRDETNTSPSSFCNKFKRKKNAHAARINQHTDQSEKDTKKSRSVPQSNRWFIVIGIPILSQFNELLEQNYQKVFEIKFGVNWHTHNAQSEKQKSAEELAGRSVYKHTRQQVNSICYSDWLNR